MTGSGKEPNVSRMYKLGTIRRTNWELIFIVVNVIWAVVALYALRGCDVRAAQDREDSRAMRTDTQRSLDALRNLGGAR